MNIKLRDYLELVRIPNVFTAAADVLAGYLYCGGGWEGIAEFAPLILASSLLYSGGMALNDACDAPVDMIERPGRPIPSGRISRVHAFRLASALLGAGLVPPFFVSPRAGIVAVALSASIILYDCVLKHTALGPVVMGTCRALNLFLGMSLSAPFGTLPLLMPVLLMWLYVSSVTFFARQEAGMSSAIRLAFGTIGVSVSAAALGFLPWVRGEWRPAASILAIGLAAILAWRGWRAVANPSPAYVQRAVGTFVLSIVFFDASVASAQSLWAALIVAGLWVPTRILAYRFRMS